MKPVKNKAAVIGFSYFGGCALCSALCGKAGTVFIFVVIGCLISAAAVSELIIRRLPPTNRRISLIFLSAGIGALVFAAYDVNIRRPVFAQAGETVSITGTVEEKNEIGFSSANYTVKTEIGSASAKIIINAPEYAYINVGDTVFADAELACLADNGVFPERSYNLSKGVLLKGGSDEIGLVKAGAKTPVSYIRRYNAFIREKISAAFPNETGGLLRAVCLGDKSEISKTPGLTLNIRNSGAAHYTTVSGLHMTMAVHMLMLVCGVMPFGKNRRVKFAVLAVSAVTLAIFFDLSRSVMRAAIMLIIFYGGELIMRRGSAVNSLGLALFLILALEPYAVSDSGLIMSFSGTFGVGVVAPAILGKAKRNAIVSGIAAGVCAGVCVLPASAVYFGGISVLSPITSVIILPFFTVAVGAVMMFAVLAPFGAVAGIPLFAAGISAKIMNLIIGAFGRVSAAYVPLDYWFTPIWVCLAVAAVAVTLLIYKNGVKAFKAACLTVAALALMICVYNAAAVNSGRTYIAVHSDGSAAWASVKKSGTETVVITSDSPKAAEQAVQIVNPRTAAVLLNFAQNNERAFETLPALEYIPPDSAGIYDISGEFILDIRRDEAALETEGYSVMFTRAANDSAAPAFVTVAYGRVVNKRVFPSEYTVYAARNIQAAQENGEYNAYQNPVYFVID